MSTGSGKSHVIAEFCKTSVQSWPSTRIIMLTHVKELITQDHEKLIDHWKAAPVGIYSAGIGIKDIKQITFAGIQSIYRKADEVGFIDIALIDECHLLNHKDEGIYRKFLKDLKVINPNLRVVGFTASPFRLGHGMITDKPAIFDALIEPITIEQLIYEGYLAKVKSKTTVQKYDLSSVHKRGGEYIESELQKAVDTSGNNEAAVKEMLDRSHGREHWLVFCTGVDHAIKIRDILRKHGVTSETLSNRTDKDERKRIISEYKEGKIKAITNVNILSTGFNYEEIDLIALLRPTMSPGLYLQQVGRGMRLKSNGGDCLILDFAGIIQQHGPITAVKPPTKKGEGEGVAPSRICPECDEIIAAQCKICPECGFVFPIVKKDDEWRLRDDDIMGRDPLSLSLSSWEWREQTAKSGKQMLVVTYYGGLSDYPIREYLTIFHFGWAGQMAMKKLKGIVAKCGVDLDSCETVSALLRSLNKAPYPSEILYKKDGKYNRVVDRVWGEVAPPVIEETVDNEFYL